MLDAEGYRRGLQRFIRLRWIATAVVFAVFGVAAARVAYPIRWAVVVAALIPASNLVHVRIARRGHTPRVALIAQFGCDLLLLTLLLATVGGIEGPTLALYMIHILLAALLLERRDAIAVLAFGMGLAVLLATAQILRLPFPAQGPGLLGVAFDLGEKFRGAGILVPQLAVFALVAGVLFALVVPLTTEARLRGAKLEAQQKSALDQAATLERLLNNMGAMMIVLDRNHVTEWFNARAAAFFPDLHVGTPRRCNDPAEPMGGGAVTRCPTCHVLESGAPWRGEYTVGVPGEQARVLRFYATPFSNGVAVHRVVEVVIDVTDERRNEQQLRASRKKGEVARLAAGVAHEMNTPLASISAGLGSVRRALESATVAPEVVRTRVLALVADLAAETSRCQRVTESILGYAGELRSRLEAAEVESIVRDAIEELGARRPLGGIEITLVGVTSRVPSVQCDPGNLRVALLNVLTNAVDSLREVVRIKPRVRVEIDVTRDDGMVDISVVDNGGGIAASVREHIFDPLYTTKPVGAGTGLGLPVTEGLMTAMGGSITIDSAPGAGTRATLRVRAWTHDLPASPGAVALGLATAARSSDARS